MKKGFESVLKAGYNRGTKKECHERIVQYY